MTEQAHLEIERTFTLDPDQVVPDLTGLPGVAGQGEPERAVLRATYLDTVDLALVRAGVTLRRRTGGHDAGWHLKLPVGGEGREELRRPLGRTADAVPAAFAEAVLGLTRGRPVAPTAEIETTRTTTHLLGADGEVLAEVADDQVVGRPLDGGEEVAWRELEIELVGAGTTLLDEAVVVLAAAGIEPSATSRKIGHVLAHRLGADVAEPLGKGRPAARLLQRRLTEQVTALLRHDAAVRRDVPDGVHQLRVACRRLRGALGTFAPLLDASATEPLREELRWLARTLGDGRDAEVMHERLRELVDQEPRVLVHGPVRRRLDRSYAERLRTAAAHGATVLSSRRYLRLLARLEQLVAAPPFTAEAQAPAREVLPACVARDYRRLRKRVDRAAALRRLDDAAAADDLLDRAYDEQLHEVRKAAKRLRYACETLEPVWGSDARALRKAAQEVTQVLGDRQDGAVARGDLRRIALEADREGESTFTYGLLHAREEARAVDLEVAWWEVWEQARDRALRSWL